jgi:hypothetical protein
MREERYDSIIIGSGQAGTPLAGADAVGRLEDRAHRARARGGHVH